LRAGDWRAFISVGLALLTTQTAFYFTAAALPLYLHDLGAGQARIGLEVGTANVVGMIANFVIGPVLDRYGPRRFLALGAIIYLVTSAGMLLLPYEVPVTLFRGLQGIGGAAVMPAAYILGSRLLASRVGTAMGLIGAISNLGLAIGPPIGLALYTVHGAQGLFIPSILAAVVGLLCVIPVPATTSSSHRTLGFTYSRSWTRLLIGYGLAVFYWGGVIAYLPLVLRAEHGANAGIFFTADAIGVLVLRIPTGMFTDRYGTLLAKTLGVVTTLPGIAALALSPTIPALVVAGVFTGGSAGLLIPGVMADLSRLSSEENRGTAMALGGGAFSAAVFLGSATSGLLVGPGGFTAVLVVGFVACLAALPFLWTWP
jgi:MFS family permease